MKLRRVFMPLAAAVQFEEGIRPQVAYVAFSPTHGWSRWGATPQEASVALRRAIVGNKTAGQRRSRRVHILP